VKCDVVNGNGISGRTRCGSKTCRIVKTSCFPSSDDIAEIEVRCEIEILDMLSSPDLMR
jgi:hypothetical protein